jgi:alpha/beta superfamily hydrolase
VAQQESFDIAGPAGRLEAILMHPDAPPVAAAVVCHAHPLHGGVMHFKVVFRAAKALQQEGAAALRFNFRGVGRSQGTHDDGRGEQDDVRAALGEMQGRFPGLPLLVGGFSFGATTALRVGLHDDRVRAAFALGLPLSHLPDTSFLDGSCIPRLFVQGARDEFGPEAALRAVVEPLPAPREVVVVPDADHFFGGHLDELFEAVRGWAARRPWEAA